MNVVKDICKKKALLIFALLWSISLHSMESEKKRAQGVFDNEDLVHLIMTYVIDAKTPHQLWEQLKKMGQINKNLRSYWSPFIVVMSSDDRALKKLFRKWGFSINHKGKQGRTLLHSAVIANKSEIVKALLYQGIDPIATDDFKQTPFFLSSTNTTFDVMYKQLTHSERKRCSSINALVPSEIEEHLLVAGNYRGLNKYIENHTGVFLMDAKIIPWIIITVKDKKIFKNYIKFVCNRLLFDRPSKHNYYPYLRAACRVGNEAAVEYILDTYCVPNVLDSNWMDDFRDYAGECIQLAVTAGSESIIDLFDKKTNSIDDKQEVFPFKGENRTLYIAAKLGMTKLVDKFIAAGVCISSEDLLGAAEEGYLDIVAKLIDAGAEVDGTCKGKTSLMVAAKKGYKDIVVFLLDRGANINLIIEDTALGYALKSNHDEVAQLLLEKGADLNASDLTEETLDKLIKFDISKQTRKRISQQIKKIRSENSNCEQDSIQPYIASALAEAINQNCVLM